MLTIGIVGGIASGKSSVALKLHELGAALVDVDKIGHDVLEESEVKKILVGRWGEQILTLGGKIDRRQLAKIVFAQNSASELRFLERVVFPRITAKLEAQLDDLRGGTLAAVVDAAVLFKAGWHQKCDVIVYVDTDEPHRRERARQSRNWPEDQFIGREAAQVSLKNKKNQSDVIIDNNGTIEQTYRQAEQFWHSLDGCSPVSSS